MSVTPMAAQDPAAQGPAVYDLYVYAGDTYTWTFELYNDEAGTDPYDLTNASPEAEVRLKSAQPVLAVLACAVTLPNVCAVTLTSTESSKLRGTAKAAWDLQFSFPGTPPRVKTPVAGVVYVTDDMTDSS